MKKTQNTNKLFYYSTKKLFLYLLFNIALLLLALLFTWTIFPQYGIVYKIAIGLCLVSILSLTIVIFIRHPLAVLSPQTIQIDLCCPLCWKDILSVNKIVAGKIFFKKEILTFTIKDISKYKLNFMQRLIRNSRFSAFSIPLYAMNKQEAEDIETLIRKHIKS